MATPIPFAKCSADAMKQVEMEGLLRCPSYKLNI